MTDAFPPMTDAEFQRERVDYEKWIRDSKAGSMSAFYKLARWGWIYENECERRDQAR